MTYTADQLLALSESVIQDDSVAHYGYGVALKQAAGQARVLDRLREWLATHSQTCPGGRDGAAQGSVVPVVIADAERDRLVALARRAPALTPEHTLVQIDWCISHYDRNDAALEMLRAYRKLVAQLHAPAPPEAR